MNEDQPFGAAALGHFSGLPGRAVALSFPTPGHAKKVSFHHEQVCSSGKTSQRIAGSGVTRIDDSLPTERTGGAHRYRRGTMVHRTGLDMEPLAPNERVTPTSGDKVQMQGKWKAGSLALDHPHHCPNEEIRFRCCPQLQGKTPAKEVERVNQRRDTVAVVDVAMG